MSRAKCPVSMWIVFSTQLLILLLYLLKHFVFERLSLDILCDKVGAYAWRRIHFVVSSFRFVVTVANILEYVTASAGTLRILLLGGNAGIQTCTYAVKTVKAEPPLQSLADAPDCQDLMWESDS